MPTSTDPADHWQGKLWSQLLAVVIGVLPLYSGSLILQFRAEQQISVQGFTLYLAVVAPASIVVVLLLQRFLCGENPRDLNLKPGRLSSDLVTALILSVVIIGANVLSTEFFSQLLPESQSNPSVRDLFREIAGSPGKLIMFAGPLLLLGAASEEVIRVFLLSRLWKVWPSMPAKLAAVFLSAFLFGLIHFYQGPAAIGAKSVIGLTMAVYYLRFGRIVPLILAHYLTNALQVAIFFAQTR